MGTLSYMYNVQRNLLRVLYICYMSDALKTGQKEKKCDGEPEALRIPDMCIMFNELKYLSSSHYLSIYVFMLELVN